MQSDNYYLQLCEALGRQAAIKGNPPAGAILVRGGKIISEAAEASKDKNDITCHAELEALRLAVKRSGTDDLSGCIMYTTHEPCIMCSYAIRFYKIKKVVYRYSVACLGGVSSSMPLLTTNEVPPHWDNAPVVVHQPE